MAASLMIMPALGKPVLQKAIWAGAIRGGKINSYESGLHQTAKLRYD
jgi:hypothetical protein